MLANFKAVLLFLLLTDSILSFAHGEDRPGPHGGFIKMPAAFHVEVVPVKPNRIKVYLLDMNWKHPTVQDSTVTAQHFSSKKVTKFNCAKSLDHFICEGPTDLVSGRLEVQATRIKQKGQPAVYDLPFQLEGNKTHHH